MTAIMIYTSHICPDSRMYQVSMRTSWTLVTSNCVIFTVLWYEISLTSGRIVFFAKCLWNDSFSFWSSWFLCLVPPVYDPGLLPKKSSDRLMHCAVVLCSTPARCYMLSNIECSAGNVKLFCNIMCRQLAVCPTLLNTLQHLHTISNPLCSNRHLLLTNPHRNETYLKE